MARVKSPFGEPRIVPWLGDRTVAPGETVEVPDAALASYLEGGWQPGQDAHTKALVEKLRKAKEPAGEQGQGEQSDASGEEA